MTRKSPHNGEQTMSKLKHLRIGTIDAMLEVDGGFDRGPRAVLNIGYKESHSWHGCYLTPLRARKLRDWLTAWLKEHGGEE